jgi:hypothetical protein
MANDFKKAEPTKTERVLYELAMRLEMNDRSLHSTSAHVIALSMAMGVDPAKVAEILTDDEKIKDYAKKINEAIDKIAKEKTPSLAETEDSNNEVASLE